MQNRPGHHSATVYGGYSRASRTDCYQSRLPKVQLGNANTTVTWRPCIFSRMEPDLTYSVSKQSVAGNCFLAYHGKQQPILALLPAKYHSDPCLVTGRPGTG